MANVPIVEPDTSEQGRSKGLIVVRFTVFLVAWFGCEGFGTTVVAGDVAGVEGNLTNGTTHGAVQHNGRPPLIAAIVKGQPEVVNALLLAGADPKVLYEREAAIMYATVKSGCSDAIVGLLLAKGADPNVRDLVTGSTPLLKAAASGNDQCVASMMRSGARADVENGRHENAVWNATLGGNLVTLDRLVTLGIDANKANSQGVTALMVAASAGNMPIIKRLIEVHADECARDSRGRSARAMAERRGHAEAVRMLSKCEAHSRSK